MKSIATVSQFGEVEAISVGTVEITATSDFDSNQFGTVSITVTPKPRVLTVEVALDTALIVAGETTEATATVSAEGGASEAVVWSSSNEGVATVQSTTGATIIINGESQGTATITAISTVDNSVLGEATLTVAVASKVTSVLVTPPTASVNVNETVQLTEILTVTGDASRTVTWISSDTNVAMVNTTGLVTVVGEGEVTITAQSTATPSVSGSSIVTVINRDPVVDNPIADTTFEQGQTFTIDLTTVFSDPDGDVLTYTVLSNSESVVAVEESNNVLTVTSAAFLGTSNITIIARNSNGNSVSDEFMVTIINAALTVSTPIQDEVRFSGFGSFTIDVSQNFSEDNTNNVLTFSAMSGSTAVATVSFSGSILTITEGTLSGVTIITVTADDGNGGTVSDEFTLTVNIPFSIANEGLLAGFSIQDTINAQNIISLSGEGFASSNLIFAGGFNSSNASGLLYESGGDGTGTTIGLNNNAFIVSAGGGNNIDAQVTELSLNTSYVYIVQILPGDRIDIWLQEGIAISSITGVADATGMITSTNLDGGDESGYLTTGDAVQFALSDFVGNATEILLFVNQLNLVSQAPTVASAIADVTQEEGYGSFTVDLSSVFTDANGDALTLTAVSSNPDLATVVVSGTTLTVSEVGTGASIVTVTADDGNGITVSDDFRVINATSDATRLRITMNGNTVNPANHLVEIQLFNNNQLVLLDTGLIIGTASTNGEPTSVLFDGEVNAGRFLDFGEVSPTAIVYNLGENYTFEEVLLHVLDGNNRTYSDVTVEISNDNGATYTLVGTRDVSDNAIFSLTPSAPTVVSEITDVAQAEGYGSFTLLLGNIFTDANGDALTLTAVSSNSGLATVAISGTTLTVSEVSGIGTSIITVTADDGNGGTVNDDFTLIVNATGFAVFGYRVTISRFNSFGRIILRVAEGDIFDVDSTTDLLADITPTGSPAASGSSFENFNDEVDNQTIGVGLYHSQLNNNIKKIQVLGTTALAFPSGTIRIRIVGSSNQSDNNDYVVTLLDANGDDIGTPSNASSGFVDNNAAHDGFIVDFDATTGAVTQQPTIFDLSGSLPPLSQAPTVASEITDVTQAEGYGSFMVDLNNVFTDANGDALIYTVVSSNPDLATVTVSGTILTVSEVGTGASIITVTADDGNGDNGGTVSDEFTLTVDSPFSIANEGLLAGFSIQDTINAQNIISLSGEGFASSNLIFAGGFNSSNASGLLYESGGDGTGTTIGLNNNAFIVSAGGGNNIDAQVTGLSPNRNYVYIVQILPGNRVDIWLQEGMAISSITEVADATGMITGDIDGGGNPGYLTTEVTAQFALPDFVGNATEILLFVNQRSLVPQAPTVANAIADIFQFEGYNSFTVDLSSVFTDADDDVLTLTAVSSNSDLATVVVSGTTLTVSEVGTGASIITVTADDGNGGIVSDDFRVSNATSDATVLRITMNGNTQNTSNQLVEIQLFNNNQLVPLNTELITGTASINGEPTSVLFDGEVNAGRFLDFGEASPTAIVYNFGENYTFDEVRLHVLDGNNRTYSGVIVELSNDNGVTYTTVGTRDISDNASYSLTQSAPIITSEITDVIQAEGYDSFTVDLRSVFTDLNDDVLTFTTVSENVNLATVTISGTTLTVTEVSGRGTVRITVRANDGNGGIIDDDFTLTVDFPFLIANEGFLDGFSIQDTINAQNIAHLSGENFETSNLIYAGGFNSSNASGLLYETGGNGRGTTIGLNNNAFIVSSGIGNNIDAQVTGLSPNRNYVYIVQILPSDRIDIWLQEGIAISSITGVADATGMITGDEVSGSGGRGYLTTGGTVQFALPDFVGNATEILLFVNQPNLDPQAPTVVSAIADTIQTEGYGSFTVDLSSVFTDANGDALTFTAESDNEGLATVAVSGAILTVSEASGIGISTITVIADDGNGGIVSDNFRVSNATSDATVLRITMNGNTVNSGNHLVEIQLFNNNELVLLDTELIIGTASTNGEPTSVLFDGEVNAGRFFGFGDASPTAIVYNFGENYTFDDVLLHVFDGDNRTYPDVTVEISNDNGVTYMPVGTRNVSDNASYSLTQSAPTVVSEITDVTQAEGYGSFTVDLSSVFTDLNDDVLTFITVSENIDLATVTISETTLTVTEVSGRGTVRIIVRVNDGNGGTVDDDFILTVDFAFSIANEGLLDGFSIQDTINAQNITHLSGEGFESSNLIFAGGFNSSNASGLLYESGGSGTGTTIGLNNNAFIVSSGIGRNIDAQVTGLSLNTNYVYIVQILPGDRIDIWLQEGRTISSITGAADATGMITATNLDGGHAPEYLTVGSGSQHQFSLPSFVGNATEILLFVNQPNLIPQVPTVVNPIDNIMQEQNYVSFTVDLSSVFTDANGDALTFTAESGNTGLASVSVSGTNLTVSEVSGIGISTITVTADDGNGGTVSDEFTLTVEPDFSIANEGLLAGFSIEETINAQNIIHLSEEGFATSNLIFAGGFNSSNASGLLYESGGSDTGITIGLHNNAFVVSAGTGNNIDAQVTGLSTNRNYVYIVQILPSDRITIWLQEGVAISSIIGVADTTGMITEGGTSGGDESGYLTTEGTVQFALPDFVGSASEILLFVNQLDDLATQAPIVASAIADVTQREEYGSFTVDLSSVFTDVNSDALTLTAESSDTSLATVTVSGTTLTVSEVSGTGTATITVTADDGNGGTVSDEFILTVLDRLAVFGYRVTASTPNSSSGVILQVSEGDIFDGDSTTDLLADVTPTGSTVGVPGTSLANFNDEVDNQAVSGLYHSQQNSGDKEIQVLGMTALAFESRTIRIRIVGRDQNQSRNNSYVVTLLDANGDDIGMPANEPAGFENGNTAHDGFFVDFDARTGLVTQQPTIFDLNDPLPSISPQPPTVVSEIPDNRQFEGYGSFTVDLSSVFTDVNSDALMFTAESDDTGLASVSVSGAILTVTEVSGTGESIITVTADDGNGGTVSDEFTLTVLDLDSRLAVFGYRLSSSTPNSGSNIILQLAEGSIFDGSSTTDVLAGITPTGSPGSFGKILTNFNDEVDNQAAEDLYHTFENSSDKMIQVLGTERLGFPSDIITIRVVGRNEFQSRNNGIVVTLLDVNGDEIGTPSNEVSGFVDDNAAHDGFTVSFNTITGAVTQQPTIFSL